jgi:hypothetical protein
LSRRHAAWLCSAAWLAGTLRSAGGLALSPQTSALFAAGALFFMYWASLRPALGAFPPPPLPGLRVFFFRALMLTCLIFGARQALVALYGERVYDPLGVFMFFIPRYRGPYEGLPCAPFTDWSLLSIPLFWLGCCLWALPRLAGLRDAAALAGLFVLAFGGKLALACLNTDGLLSLGSQVAGISTHYYELARRISGQEWRFVANFNAIQPYLSTHGESHPFGPELFYGLMIRLLSPDPLRVALGVAALTSLIVVPLWGLARESGLPKGACLAAAALYACSPPSLILASAGIDCVIALLMACGLWAWMAALRRGGFGLPLAAGLIAFFASLLSQAALYLLLLYALLALPRLLEPAGRRSAAAQFSAALLPVMAGHAALWLATSGSFRYDRVMAYASGMHGPGEARPYRIWSWGNGLLFLGYAGLGNAAAYGGSLRRLQAAGALYWAGLASLTVMLLNGLGHIEIQRIYLWAYAFLALGAAPWAASKPAYLKAALILNAVTAMLLNVLLLDYW